MLKSVKMRLKAAFSSKWAFEAAVIRTNSWFAQRHPE
jgi:hypothetical protein